MKRVHPKSIIRSVFFFALILLPAVIYGAGEENLTPGVDASRSLNPHWHKPSLEIQKNSGSQIISQNFFEQPPIFKNQVTMTAVQHPAENRVLYTKYDSQSRCDQVFMHDLDANAEVRLTNTCGEVRLTDWARPGDKFDAAWGVYIPQLVYDVDRDYQPETYNGWAIVYAALDFFVSQPHTRDGGSSIYMKLLGPSLKADDVSRYVTTSPEIYLTYPRYGVPQTRDIKPQMRFAPSGNQNLSIVFVRKSDPTVGNHDMIYSLQFNPIALFNPIGHYLCAGWPVFGVTERNLTYHDSSACGNSEATDFDDPQWFADGKNLVFTSKSGLGYSQIATLSADETRGVEVASPLPTSYPTSPTAPTFSCPVDLPIANYLCSATTTLKFHTQDPVHHEHPQPSPLPLYEDNHSAHYGILYHRLEAGTGGREKDTLAGFTVYQDLSTPTLLPSVIGLQTGFVPVAQIMSSHGEEILGFSNDANRRRPVWSYAIERNKGFGWIGYERGDADYSWQIYGTQIWLAPSEAPRSMQTMPLTTMQAATGTEFRFTNCPGDHYWPEFAPVLNTFDGVLSSQDSLLDIAYGKQINHPGEDHQIVHLFDLPNALLVDACSPPPPPPPPPPPSECPGRDDDGDGLGNECDNCRLYNPDQRDANGNGLGDVCEEVPTRELPPGLPPVVETPIVPPLEPDGIIPVAPVNPIVPPQEAPPPNVMCENGTVLNEPTGVCVSVVDPPSCLALGGKIEEMPRPSIHDAIRSRGKRIELGDHFVAQNGLIVGTCRTLSYGLTFSGSGCSMAGRPIFGRNKFYGWFFFVLLIPFFHRLNFFKKSFNTSSDASCPANRCSAYLFGNGSHQRS